MTALGESSSTHILYRVGDGNLGLSLDELRQAY